MKIIIDNSTLEVKRLLMQKKNTRNYFTAFKVEENLMEK